MHLCETRIDKVETGSCVPKRSDFVVLEVDIYLNHRLILVNALEATLCRDPAETCKRAQACLDVVVNLCCESVESVESGAFGCAETDAISRKSLLGFRC